MAAVSHERHDVEIFTANRLEAAHRRASELVKDQRRLNERLASFFEEIAEVRELLRDEGSVWQGPVLEPLTEAAFAVWLSRGPHEHRLELTTLPAMPLMELE